MLGLTQEFHDFYLYQMRTSLATWRSPDGLWPGLWGRLQGATTMRDRTLFPAFVGVAIVFGQIGSATAQPYPARPITIVAPFPPGGPTDSIARVMAEAMSKSLNQPVIVENIT